MSIKKILGLAFFVYVSLAPLTFHSDNKGVLRWVSDDWGSVWNIYDYSLNKYGPSSVFNYPPLHFWIDKLEWPLAKIVGGRGYKDWLDQSTEISIYSPNIYRYNLATKLPLILVAILAGWLIYSLVLKQTSDKNCALAATLIWFFNPFTIYAIPIMGQNDVLAITMFLWGWLNLEKAPKLTSVLMGLSIAIKVYPILWILVIIGLDQKYKLGSKLKILLGSIVVYGLTILPYLSSQAYRNYSLNDAINQRFLIPQISLGFNDVVYLVPTMLLIILMMAFIKSSQTKLEFNYLVLALLSISLVLFGTVHFHPQWFLAIGTFGSIWLALDYLNLNKRLALTFILICWLVVVVLFDDKFLTLGLLTPGNPNLINLGTISQLLMRAGIKSGTIINLAHTGLFATAVGSMLWLTQYKFESLAKTSLRLIKYKLGWKWLFLPIGLALLMIGMPQLIPTPIGVLDNSDPSYIIPNSAIETNFIAKFDNLKQIQISARNVSLRSKDVWSFILKNKSGQVVAEIPFSGFNFGDPTLTYFSFPPIKDSIGKEFTIILNRQSVSDEPLKIGMNSSGGSSSNLYFNQIYNAQFKVGEIIKNCMNRLELYVRQLWWWWLLIELGLSYVIFTKDQNE